jgi:DNA-binding NarL/FixJ family response regulator
MRPRVRYRVLVADDVADMRFLVRTALERSRRFTVVAEAANGAEAIAAAGRTQPDLAVLDLAMPVMDGLQALPRIRREVPTCTVVVLSAFDTDAMQEPALRAGAAGYLAKGLPPKDLVAQLLDVMASAQAPARDLAHAAPELDGMTVSLPPELSSVRQARRFVQRVLKDWRRTGALDEVMLLTSELVTNAVVHARSAAQLTIVAFTDRVRVEVADFGSGALQFREPDADDVSGRGLLLVQEMSRNWGTSSDEARKVVWFEV